MIGTILERRYKITGTLGEGSLGRTHTGTDVKGGAPVVVKLLGRGLAGEASSRNRFLGAVAMQRDLAGRSHSPDLLAAKLEEGHPGAPVYLIRSYVKGFTLRQTLGQGPAVPLDVTLEIFGGLLDYLEELEARGFRHGGLVPENVVLTEDGGVAVLDPGLALPILSPGMPLPAALEARAPYTAPGYLEAPYFEDLRGDFYSVARLMEGLLAPLRAKGAVEATRQAVRITDEVLGHALKPYPGDRFANVAEFRKSLDAAVRKGGAGVAPPVAAKKATASPIAEAPTVEEVRSLAGRCADLDYYELFGVPPEASLEEIQRHYYALLARYHPQRAQVSPFTEVREELLVLSNKVNEIYSTLRDPIARSSYDERRTYRLQGRRPTGGVPRDEMEDLGDDGIVEDEPVDEGKPSGRKGLSRLFGRRGASDGSS